MMLKVMDDFIFLALFSAVAYRLANCRTKPRKTARARYLFGITLIFGSAIAWASDFTGQSLIRRDTYGVPHILAKNEPAAAFAQGYATAEDHFEQLARLFLRAQGRQAAVFGESFLRQDLLIHQLGIWDKAQEHFDDLPPHMQAILNAYAEGYNLYLSQHQGSAPEWAKPITGVDLLAHCRAVLLLDFSLDLREWRQTKPAAASNMWAIGRERSASGHGMLLANPHLQWTGSQIFHELQLTVPGKINISGATLIGFPVVTIGFNEYLGWSHTVNEHRSDDIYELTLDPADPMQYIYDGMRLPIKSRSLSIQVKTPHGEESVHRTLLFCHFGPIIRITQNKAYAYKSANLDLVNFLTEYNLIAKAKSFAEFREILNMQQLPMFNIGYADRDGNIYYLYNSRIPIRPAGIDWNKPVRGDISDTEWYAIHPIAELPQLLNPAGGYIQNANDAPWYSTMQQAINPALFPDYMKGTDELALRGQISLRMLESTSKLSLEEIKRFKYNETFGPADRLGSDLISLAIQHSAEDAGLAEAAQVLKDWNHSVGPDSRGAVLFNLWWEEYRRKASPVFKVPWSAKNPLDTPRGMGEPARALSILNQTIAIMKKEYGSLSVRWGDVHRLRRGNVDVAIGGVSGTFRSIGYRRDADGKWVATGGDSYVLAVEFTQPPTAFSIVAYSESDDIDSKHFNDQSKLFAADNYKPAWFTEADIQKHLESSYAPESQTNIAGKNSRPGMDPGPIRNSK
jgi:acyl-homoserine-lactone acylase